MKRYYIAALARFGGMMGDLGGREGVYGTEVQDA